MQGTADETVGEQFKADLLQAARDKTLRVILDAAQAVGPGMTEPEAKSLISQLQARLGAPKSWHPPQIRFGKNTLLPFGAKGEDGVRLGGSDIFFFDVGPIFDGHEGDVGRTFAVGNDPELHRCCQDVESIWKETRAHWLAAGATGAALYAFAAESAKKRGWLLTLDKANGHRIADFPHAAKARGSIEGFAAKPAPNRWILEIQIRHPKKPFGAFYEDLLN